MTKGDILVYPIVIFSAIFLRYVLLLINIQNNVVYLSVLFLFLHLLITGLLRYQLAAAGKEPASAYVTPLEVAGVGAMFVTIVAIVSYIGISFMPMLKLPFYPLRFLPYSNIWLDLFIVATPAVVANMIVRNIGAAIL